LSCLQTNGAQNRTYGAFYSRPGKKNRAKYAVNLFVNAVFTL